MCPLCKGRGVMWNEIVSGCTQVVQCPNCEPKSREEIDRGLATFTKRLHKAIAEQRMKENGKLHPQASGE
ncbi:hypothetical protein SAMN05421676_11239 [Salinibacillus kushneri]|uniref:Uncharacterized protein n=1 Tax=Salinibacillus kushneri TaxID=237682 RepID=A0A1I0IEM0_9BACI|nr:hypothetical protein SAMN05421676_11239 [Salinibacillus kushneri]